MDFTGERFIPELFGQIQLEHLSRYHFVYNQIDLSDKIVLDLSSGEGYGTDLLSNFAKKVYGIDISIEAISHAQKKYIRDNLAFLVGDVAAIPLRDNSIDVFVSFETIEHIDKHKEMFIEIKRVLKPDGILVMSSPDRYYYSDKPQFNNQYHIKELYYDEFCDLVNHYFQKTRFYSQRIFSGSMIVYNGNADIYSKPLVMEKNGSAVEFTPLYNIAIATDKNDLKSSPQVFLYKEFDYILTMMDVQRAINSIRRSKAYRFGDFFLRPARLLKKYFLNE